MGLLEVSQPSSEAIQSQLERILSSQGFLSARRSKALLRYIVQRTQVGAPPKEYEIAVEVFERNADYDPAVDATVRVEAGRLRSRLREYYGAHGKDDPVGIDIPKGGYVATFRFRFEDSVSGLLPKPESELTGPAPDPEAQLASMDRATKPYRSVTPVRARVTLVWLSVAALVMLSASVALFLLRTRHHGAGRIRSLAVLPLQNLSGNPDEEYFADGMTDALITELAHNRDLRVVSRTSVMRFKANQTSLRQIASDLGVDAVVEGSITRAGNRVRITAQLIDARDDRHLWSRNFEEQMTDVLMLEDQVCREIAAQTKSALDPNQVRPKQHSVDSAAYDAYMRGLYFLNRRELQKSSNYFQQAIGLDPNFAAAYAGLASALDSARLFGEATPGTEERALAAAHRAIQLDPESGEAHTALGFIEMGFRQWNAARHDLVEALELSLNYSLAYVGYAIYLDACNQAGDAVKEMRRAVQLDPLSFYANRHLGSALYFAGHYEESLTALNRAAEMSPKRGDLIWVWASRSYEMQHNYKEAMKLDLESWDLRHPGLDSRLRSAYERNDWRDFQRQKILLLRDDTQNGCQAYDIGLSNLRLGNMRTGVAALLQGSNRSCFWYDDVQIDPMLSSLRRDPAYSSLLVRLNMSDER